MAAIVESEPQIPGDSQQEREDVLTRSAERATKRIPKRVKVLIVAAFVQYLVLACLLIAVATSAGSGG